MALKMKLARLLIQIFVIYLSSSLALRNYMLISTDIKCIVKQDYVANISCFVDRSPPFPRLNIEGGMLKEVKDFRVDFSVHLVRPKKSSILVVQVSSLEGCDVFNKNVTHPILKMYMQIMSKAGKFPQCPIPVGFQFKFRNITLDSDLLPSYAPEATFKIVTVLKDKKIKFWQSTSQGQIIYKKNGKTKLKINV